MDTLDIDIEDITDMTEWLSELRFAQIRDLTKQVRNHCEHLELEHWLSMLDEIIQYCDKQLVLVIG